MPSSPPPDPVDRAGPDAAHRLAVGAAVRAQRARRRLTQRDLASVLEVSVPTISAIESGRTGVSTARATRIAAALGVDVQELLLATPALPVRPTAAPPGVRRDGLWRRYPPLVLDAALDAALACFTEVGYHGATMRAIAARAGLSVPGLYHYYAGKQEMLVAILELTMADLTGRTRAARSEGRDPVERFAQVVECLALFHTHRRELGFVGASEMRSLAPAARARVTALRRAEQRVVDDAVLAGVAAGVFGTERPREAARAVVTLCVGLAQWFREDGAYRAEQIAAQYVGFALDLVGCDPSLR